MCARAYVGTSMATAATAIAIPTLRRRCVALLASIAPSPPQASNQMLPTGENPGRERELRLSGDLLRSSRAAGEDELGHAGGLAPVPGLRLDPLELAGRLALGHLEDGVAAAVE